MIWLDRDALHCHRNVWPCLGSTKQFTSTIFIHRHTPVWTSWSMTWWLKHPNTMIGVGPLCFLKPKVSTDVHQDIFMLPSTDELYILAPNSRTGHIVAPCFSIKRSLLFVVPCSSVDQHIFPFFQATDEHQQYTIWKKVLVYLHYIQMI